MNDRQRTVVGIAVVALILATLFFIPWRVESTGEIEWVPAYRQPISYVRAYSSELHDSRYRYDEGHVATGLLILEIAAIGAIGWVAFALTADPKEADTEEEVDTP